MRILAIFFVFVSTFLCAQTDSVYTERYIDRSTRFAQITVGGDVLMLGGGEADYGRNGSNGRTRYGNTFIPRLSIGGLHFWDHAEFYVSFPLSFLAIARHEAVTQDLVNLEGIETGARVYPWKLRPRAVRPFVGLSFRLKEFSLGVNSNDFPKGYPTFQKMITPVQAGVSYAKRSFLVSVSTYYQPLEAAHYYTTPLQTGSATFQNFSFNLSIVRYWDSDRHMRNQKSVRQLNVMDSILRVEKKMSTWYWGIGPSVGLQMSSSQFLKDNYPYLANDYAGGFMPDFTFGRFFEKPDMNIGVSYRTFGSSLRGFDTEVRMRRHSFMLEAYKNLFNYLGFVPYIGVTGSMENLTTTVNGTAYAETKPAVGLIFGWDIRVTKTGTNILRTNLRWIPDLHMTIDDKKMMYDQLEFNFIQWVQLIGRKKVYQKYR